MRQIQPEHDGSVASSKLEEANWRDVVQDFVSQNPRARAIDIARALGCTEAQALSGQESADGTLICSILGPTPHWDEKPLQGPAYRAGTPCTQAGARAPAALTEGNVTCLPGPDGVLVWSFS